MRLRPEAVRPPERRETRAAPKAVPPKPARAERRLTFQQQQRLDRLPARIERLELEIAKLEDFLADPDLYTREPIKFAKASEGLAERQAELEASETEWLELEALREELAGG